MRKILLLLFVVLLNVQAQQRTITGRVTGSDDGNALPGVSVLIKGTTRGALTDIDGNYTLQAAARDVLVFSFVGYVTREVTLSSDSRDAQQIDIELRIEVEQLTEIVVTAGGVEADRRSLGYSVQEVQTSDVLGSGETNFTTALSGKVPGLQIISTSGTPGASASIKIRGSTSITGNNSPLMVIDGVPFDNNGSGNQTGVGSARGRDYTSGVDESNRAIDINPNDIASVTVLKGPSATALYGVRAANGALIITTKTGKSGGRERPLITARSSFTLTEINRFPELQRTYAQGLPTTGGSVITRLGSYYEPETEQGGSFGPRISDLEFNSKDATPYSRYGQLTRRGTGTGRPAEAYDHIQDFFVLGGLSDNNISVQGGTGRFTYYSSLGYVYQTGIIPNTDFQRINARLNLGVRLAEGLNVGFVGSYSNAGGIRAQKGSNISGIMLGLLRTSPTFDNGNGNVGAEAASSEGSYVLPSGRQRSYRAGVYDNPYWSVNRNPFRDDVNRFFGNVNASYTIQKFIKVGYRLGLDTYADSRDAGLDIFSASNSIGEITNETDNSVDYNSDFTVLVTPPLGPNFDLDVTVGHNYFRQQSYTNTQIGTSFSQSGFYNISNAGQLESFQLFNRNRGIAGVYADVRFGFRDLLYLNLSGRNDWSSTLGVDNNSFFYPAAAVGFVFTELIPSLNSNPIFSYGKLRLSWGRVGNDALAFSTDTYYPKYSVEGDGFTTGSLPSSPFYGSTSYERNDIQGNATLRPEFTTTTEVGAEFRFLRDRLTLDVTYYNSLTTDAILQVDTPPASGFLQRVANTAEIESNGFEAYLQGVLYDANDFRISTDLTFNTYENIVTKLAPGVQRVLLGGFTGSGSYAVEGEPYGALYGTRFKRRASDGRLIIGADGFPVQADEDGVIGDPNPDWTGGIRLNLGWKGLELTGLLDIRQGGDIWSGTIGVINFFGTGKLSGDLREQRGVVFDGVVESRDANDELILTEDGNPIYTTNEKAVDYLPVADENGEFEGNIYWRRYGFGDPAGEYTYDASWIRLRDLSLTYRLPSRLFTNYAISGVTVAVVTRNLFTFTGVPGIDPDTNLGGVAQNSLGLDYFNNPGTKSYGLSLQVTF